MICFSKKPYIFEKLFDGKEATNDPLKIVSFINALIIFKGFVSKLSRKISKTDNTVSTNKENLCWVPFLKKAERIDIPTSSRLVSILQNINLKILT